MKAGAREGAKAWGALTGPEAAREVAAAGLPILVFGALHRGSLDYYFMQDDPCLLASVAENGVFAHLASPEVWRALSSTLLMPLQIASLGLDHRLSGLEPRGFYAHHLGSFAFLLVCAYLLLRRLSPPFLSSVALVVFAASPPVVYVSGLLMNRHYVEGLALALLSLLLQSRAVERSWPGLSLLSAACYALSALAKEVFVPLVLLMPFLPGARGRWRWPWPHSVVLLAYGAYRLWMLGWSNSLESYGSGVPTDSSFAPRWVAGTALVAVLAMLVLGLRRPRCWPGLLALALALVTPLLFVSTALAPRHYFVPALATAGLLAAVVAGLGSRRVARALGAAAAVVSVAAAFGSGDRAALAASERLYRAEGSFVGTHAEPAVLDTTLPNSLYLSCTQRLRRASGATPRVAFCGEPCACGDLLPGAPRYAVDPAQGTVRLSPAEDPGEPCPAGDDLVIDLVYDRAAQELRWSFGPHQDGAWAILLVSREEPGGVSLPQPLPRRGSLPLSLTREIALRVEHRSPDGSLAISPLKVLRP